MFTIQERTGMMFRPPHTLPVYYIRVGEKSSNELNGRPHLLIRSGNGGRPFLYCSSLAESILRPKFQSHRHHTECQVADCCQHPDCVQRPPDDSWIVPHFTGSQDHAHGGHGNAAEQRNYKSPVPVVEAVDGESCPSSEKASTGTHRIGFQGQCRNHPCNQHREYS